MKKFHVGAIFLAILTILTFSGSMAHGLYHHVDDCSVCHYAAGAESTACTACPNNAMIKCVINIPPNADPTDTTFGPYVTGEAPYNGVCEVCHTETKFHRKDPSGDHTHYAQENCIPCHRHHKEFTHTEGLPCESCHGHEGDAGTAFSHATHTAGTVSRGPATAMVCSDCHSDPIRLGPTPMFADEKPLASTEVCAPCHSQGGAYDGITMAKGQWADGVYEADGQSLKSGNGTWCVGCHDSEGATIGDRTADDIAGDDAVYGYYASGHGHYSVGCTDCHDPQYAHIDGYDRTYDAGEVMDSPRGYQQAFRLKSVNGIRPLY